MLTERDFPNERLRRARLQKGWTQAALADMLDTDFETVSRWERGVTAPSPTFRMRLCEVLGKSAEELGLMRTSEVLSSLSISQAFVACSSAEADQSFVTQLQADLRMHNITTMSIRLLSKWGAENKQKALQEAIRAAQVILVILSPDARSSRDIRATLQLAKLYRRPTCAVWASGECWQECLPKEFGDFLASVDARAGSGTNLLDAIVDMLTTVQLTASETTQVMLKLSKEENQQEPRNPYKGLKAFGSEDKHDFFGRDLLTDKLIVALAASLRGEAQAAQSERLLAVVGPSGSGKSSVVMAGLLPRLKAGGLEGSQQWLYLEPVVPGTHPLEALAEAFAAYFPEMPVAQICKKLKDDSTRGLHLLATALVKQQQKKVVLFIDQFEELFALTLSEEERQQFIDVLITAINEPRGPMIVVLTLRADFYDRPLHYPTLGRLIEAHRVSVLPMEPQELRMVIERPAVLADVQVNFEADLVGDLLFEVQQQVGALPLLQFTLDQLFQQRNGRSLTLQAYREIGGIKGALAQHAESTYELLPSDEHRRLARALFLRLIEPGETEQDTTRRRALLSELRLPNPKETVLLQEAAEVFTQARLLTKNTIAGQATLEVSHEALIREWKRLAEWLREAREDIHLQHKISEDAVQWQKHGKPKDRLYRGSQLTEAREWLKRNVASWDELDFLQSSVKREQRARSQLHILVSITALVLLIMLVAAFVLQNNLLVAKENLLASLPVSVTNLNDHGPGSLREAINTVPSGSAITFAKNLRGTIRLTSGELKITKNVVISGPGASVLAISGGDSSRVFDINQATVTISNLTIKESHAHVKKGGGIGEATGSGGGIFNHLGSLIVLNSIITGNTADAEGGGIYNLGMLTLIDSVVSNNTSDNNGGGIFDSGTLNLTNSTVAENTSKNQGGGIYNDQWSTLNLTNTTLSGNQAGQNGGGLFSSAEPGNEQFTLIYCTIYNNTATAGGGIFSSSTTMANIMEGSIVAGNHAITSPDIAGSLVLAYPNLVQNPTGAKFAVGDPFVPPLTGVSPQLGPLQNNGGLTPTHALLPGSPAIEQIVAEKPDPLVTICGKHSIYATDQRGVKRPQEKKCDLGAYEYVPLKARP